MTEMFFFTLHPVECRYTINLMSHTSIQIAFTRLRYCRFTHSWPLWRPCKKNFFLQAWMRPHWLWGMERRNWWFHVWLSEVRTPFLCFCEERRRENKLEHSNSHRKSHSKWKMNEYSQCLNINLLYPTSEREWAECQKNIIMHMILVWLLLYVNSNFYNFLYLLYRILDV